MADRAASHAGDGERRARVADAARGDDELLAAGLGEALRLGGADAATTRTALAAERASERADAQAQLVPKPPAPAGP